MNKQIQRFAEFYYKKDYIVRQFKSSETLKVAHRAAFCYNIILSL